MALYYVLYVFISIGCFAIGMELCWCRVSATQFTLYMAISNMGRAVGASLLGPLKARMGWEFVILAVAAFAFTSLYFIFRLRMNKHLERINGIETEQASKDFQLTNLVGSNL